MAPAPGAEDIRYADDTPLEELKPAEPAADVTSQIEGVVSVTIQCDETGAPLAGEVPRENAYKLYRNGADITGDTDWSVSVLTGTITVSIDPATGILTISAISSDSRVRVGAQFTNPDTLFVVERSVEIDVKRQINIPPSAPTSAYGTINGHVTGTTMFAIAPELEVTVAAGGNVALNAFYNFTVTGSFTAGAYAQWYRWNGTVYVPLGSEVASSTTANGSIEPGDGACAYSDTGRTPGALEKYRLYGRSSNVRQVNFSGSVSAVSS